MQSEVIFYINTVFTYMCICPGMTKSKMRSGICGRVYRKLIVACIHGLLDHKRSAIEYFITRFKTLSRSYHGFIHGLTNSYVHLRLVRPLAGGERSACYS